MVRWHIQHQRVQNENAQLAQASNQIAQLTALAGGAQQAEQDTGDVTVEESEGYG